MVRSGCTVITRVNTKKLGPMMLDTALMPAAVITMAASTNRPDEAVASADAAAAGLGALASAGPAGLGALASAGPAGLGALASAGPAGLGALASVGPRSSRSAAMASLP